MLPVLALHTTHPSLPSFSEDYGNEECEPTKGLTAQERVWAFICVVFGLDGLNSLHP